MKPGEIHSDPLLLHLDPWTFPNHDDRKIIAENLRKEIKEVELELQQEVELIKALEGVNQDLLIQLADLKKLQISSFIWITHHHVQITSWFSAIDDYYLIDIMKAF